MRTIGLDVHKHFAEVAITEPGKKVRPAGRIPATPDGLRAFAATLGPDDQVVLEASFNTWAVAELLMQHAGRVVVSNPMRTKAIASAKVKTDKVDSAILAELLAADFIPEVWIPDEDVRARRRQVSHRKALVRHQVRIKGRIRSVLARNLLDCPWTDLFGKGGQQWLAGVVLPPEDRRQVDSSMRLLRVVNAELAEIDEQLTREAFDDPRVLRLMTIPGVGVATAYALVAVIGDVARFPRPNQLVGYLGLDPRVRQSGHRPAHTGHISRQGASHARALLVESAHSAVRVPGPLRAYYQRLRAHRGASIAAVATARKLVVLAWHMLSKDQDYRWMCPKRTATKFRRLEQRFKTPAPARFATASPFRTASVDEDLLLLQAEHAYREFVASRRSAMPPLPAVT